MSEVRETWSEVGPARLGAIVMAHVVLPGAIIGMACSLLFFLVALRSAFRTGDEFLLQWLGTCLVSASVLIVRHGRTQVAGGRRLIYLVALAGATTVAFAMLSSDALGLVTNLLAAAITWWFASALANQMSFEDPPEKELAEVPFYGDSYRKWLADKEARARAEEAARQQRALGGKAARPAAARASPPVAAPSRGLLGRAWHAVAGMPDVDEFRNATRGALRLALGALVVFAAAEPVILAAHPGVGPRAFLCMLAYLAFTAVVLTSGSVIGAIRHAVHRDGDVDLSLATLRPIAGTLIASAVLLSALALPGLRYVGAGTLEATSVATDPQARSGARESEDSELAADPESSQAQDDSGPRGPMIAGVPASPAVLAAVKILAGIVLLAIGVTAGRQLVALWRSGWRPAALLRLLGLRFGLGAARAPRRARPDPFAGLEALESLPPSDAIREAYGRVVAAADALEMAPASWSTPFELLRSLPRPLEPARDAVTRLTHLFVSSSYAGVPPTESDRGDALRALRQIRDGATPVPVSTSRAR